MRGIDWDVKFEDFQLHTKFALFGNYDILLVILMWNDAQHFFVKCAYVIIF